MKAMRLLHLLFIAPIASLAFVSQVQAFDTTTQSLVITGYVTSQVTTAPFDNKPGTTLQRLSPVVEQCAVRGLNRPCSLCARQMQNFMPATLNWRRQSSSNSHFPLFA
ncbi:Uncharacterized protein ALO40_03127 [Pseudomonas syringae pv. viburni]|uniref:Uncharacterized protein n=1 Tax=Pseudomonas syringae pv. viburni TaxID=251703 RepID=A0A0Q0E9V2_9PSED|nr:Uncharacterized protein ALO40_03127 [Pseudomonas syringae pv. viburni]